MTDTNRAEPMKGLAEKNARNARVQARYDELMSEGKHGHYETLFHVVREEVEASRLPLTGAAPSLTEEEREHIHQAIDMLGDYEATERKHGNDSTAAGAGATRYVLEKLFRFLPASPAPSDAAVQQPVAWLTQAGCAVAGHSPDEARLYGWTPLYTSPLPTAPADLHPRTNDLVDRFAIALKEKLADAEKKHGYSDGWDDNGWMDECRAHLVEHVHKGDPRDVAAYCAFLWHHGERTALEEQFIYDTLGKWPGIAALAAAPLDRIALSEHWLIDKTTELVINGKHEWPSLYENVRLGHVHAFVIALARAIEAEHGITLAQGEAKGDGNG